jgi:hypothetical protein
MLIHTDRGYEMSLLRTLLGRGNDPNKVVEDRLCTHPELAPMWENVADMGRQDRISRYRCLDCLKVLSVGEWEQLTTQGRARTVAA